MRRGDGGRPKVLKVDYNLFEKKSTCLEKIDLQAVSATISYRATQNLGVPKHS